MIIKRCSLCNRTHSVKARNKQNELRAKANIASRAKKDRLYPELMVGDKVKILRKKAITEEERTSHFLQREYTVESIDEKIFKYIIH